MSRLVSGNYRKSICNIGATAYSISAKASENVGKDVLFCKNGHKNLRNDEIS